MNRIEERGSVRPRPPQWTYDRTHGRIVGIDGGTVAALGSGIVSDDLERLGRLIRSAPEMRAILRALQGRDCERKWPCRDASMCPPCAARDVLGLVDGVKPPRPHRVKSARKKA